jgi:protein-S-isoprenylcysteine O-methyltransferase Ste14
MTHVFPFRVAFSLSETEQSRGTKSCEPDQKTRMPPRESTSSGGWPVYFPFMDSGRAIRHLVMPVLLMVLIGTLLVVRPQPAGLADILFWAAYGLWILVEIVRVKPDRPQDEKGDRGTKWFYALSQASVVAAGLLFCPSVKPQSAAIAGGILLAAGIALRLWAVFTLGRHYSHVARVLDDHLIIARGPYRLIRHPAYAGMLLGHGGVAAVCVSPAAAILLFCALLPSIVARIRVEEQLLYGLDGYAAYAQGRRRLLPGIW